MTGTYANSMMDRAASAMYAEASFSCAAHTAIVIILGAILVASIFVALAGLVEISLLVLLLAVLLITRAGPKSFERRKAN